MPHHTRRGSKEILFCPTQHVRNGLKAETCSCPVSWEAVFPGKGFTEQIMSHQGIGRLCRWWPASGSRPALVIASHLQRAEYRGRMCVWTTLNHGSRRTGHYLCCIAQDKLHPDLSPETRSCGQPMPVGPQGDWQKLTSY